MVKKLWLVLVIILLYYLFLLWGFDMIKQLASENLGDFLLVNISGRSQEAILTAINGASYEVKIDSKKLTIAKNQIVKNFGQRLSSLRHGGLL